MYLLPEFNLQLRPRLLALAPGTRIVSHDWDMGDWLPDQTLTIEVPEKSIGREKRSRVHLWWVPVQLQGLWCGPGASLHISQRFQQFSATVSRPDAANPNAAPLVLDGRIQGTALSVPLLLAAQLRWEGSALVLDAPARRFEQTRFVRTAAPQCNG
jgi:hypothetical protein